MDANWSGAAEAAFWRELNPHLTIERSGSGPVPLALDEARLDAGLELIVREGYWKLGEFLPRADVDALRRAVDTLASAGHHPLYIYLYDQVWDWARRLQAPLSAMLGEDYKAVPHFWAWRIEPDTGAGWFPHRDTRMHRQPLTREGLPTIVTTWLPLSTSTPDNGCLYILPADRDPHYKTDAIEIPIHAYQSIRALLGAPGDLFFWNQAVLHWGGRSSRHALEPRMSIGFDFQRADIWKMYAPGDDPFAPGSLPSFSSRMRWVLQNMVTYQHVYGVPEHDVAAAASLIEALGLELKR